MSCCFLVPNRHLSECWRIINWISRDKLNWKFYQMMNYFIQENAFQNSVGKRSPFVQAAICWISPWTHWGRGTHICVSELTIIGSDNGLSPGRHQDIIWNNAGLLLIEPLGTNFSEISIGIQTFSFKKMHLNMSSAKCRPFCLGLNVINNACYPWGVVRFLQSDRQAEVILHPYLMCALSFMLCYRINCILSLQLHVFPKSLYVMQCCGKSKILGRPTDHPWLMVGWSVSVLSGPSMIYWDHEIN